MKRMVAIALLSVGMISSAYALHLEVSNKSKASIHHLYVSDSGSKAWGPDQLGSGSDDTVDPGHKFTLHGIEAGTYDVKLVTEDGTECEVDGVEFDESKVWVVTEGILAKCG